MRHFWTTPLATSTLRCDWLIFSRLLRHDWLGVHPHAHSTDSTNQRSHSRERTNCQSNAPAVGFGVIKRVETKTTPTLSASCRLGVGREDELSYGSN
ncbi:uncharacterized, partial [Tachysurus ichikawai]